MQWVGVMAYKTLVSLLLRDGFPVHETVPNARFAKFVEECKASLALKLFEEVGELLAKPNDPEEYADVLEVLADLASLNNVDLDAIYVGRNLGSSSLRIG